MIDASVLRAALVARLRDIKALVELVDGDEENIVDYIEEENGDSFATIADLTSPKLLVMHQACGGSGGKIELWKQDFSIVVRVAGSPSAVLKQIVDGVPATGSGMKMLLQEIDSAYHSMSIPLLQRRVIPVTDKSSFDYWEILISFTSKGFE